MFFTNATRKLINSLPLVFSIGNGEIGELQKTSIALRINAPTHDVRARAHINGVARCYSRTDPRGRFANAD